MLRWLVKPLVLFLGVGFFLGGVIALGRLALDSLRLQGRCTVSVAEVGCASPPGMSRVDFLDEVQYLASLPGSLNLLDDGLAARLATAFARHPWVAEVQEVAVVPPRRVEVKLLYRRPALAVPLAGRMRVVDGQGVLLPPSASRAGLPVYQGKAPAPAGPAGAVWGDVGVEAAAHAADQTFHESAH